MKTAVLIGLALVLAAGNVTGETLALVAADSTTNETAAQAGLQGTGKFSSVTVIDVQAGTPDLATLGTYDDVLVWTAAAPFDKTALGDVLANFYDLPNKHLTVATYAFSTIQPVAPFFLPDPELQGRVMTAGYAALTNAAINGNVSGTLAAVADADPIFSGSDLTMVFYAENQYFAHPGLAPGAALLATDGGSPTPVNMIARSQNGVVNVNFYPGGTAGQIDGDNNTAFFTLLANTFVPLNQAPAVPAAPTANPGGPYTFCTDSKPWVLDGSKSVDPEQGKSDPGLPGDQIIQYAWDLSGTGAFTDASGPQPDATAFFSKLGPGSYPVRLRVTASTETSFPSSGLANLTGTASTQGVVTGNCSCVSDLAAAVTGDAAVRLTWSRGGAHRFKVYRGTASGGPYSFLASTGDARYLDKKVTAGTTYYYVVREATSTGTETCQSNEAHALLTHDAVPPASEAKVWPPPTAQGWNNSDLLVEFQADDTAGGGLKQISVTWTGAETGSAKFTHEHGRIHLSAEGVTTVTYFSTDQAGNAETPKTLTVMIDKTAPAVIATVTPVAGSTSETVTFTGADSLSGIKSCTLPVTLSPSGERTAKGSCEDNAGNRSQPVTETLNPSQVGSSMVGSGDTDHHSDDSDGGR